MKAYVQFVDRHRLILLFGFLALTVLAAAGLPRIEVNPSLSVFQLEHSTYQDTLDRMQRIFGTSDQLLVAVDTGDKSLSERTVAELRKIQAHFEGVAGVQQVNGPAPSEIEGDDWSMVLGGPLSEEDIAHLAEHYEGMGKLSSLVEVKGELVGVYSLFTGEKFSRGEISHIEEYLRSRGASFSITGDAYMQQKLIDYIQSILRFLPVTALLLVLIVFRTQMGSSKATILSIVPAGIAALWTMGIVGWIGRPVSIITVLAPIFTVVIGSADGLHFVSHVQDGRREGKSRHESISSTLRMVGVPMIITTVTSMAGFLSLLVMNTRAIHDLALFASLGILLAGVATWYVLPVILTGSIELEPCRKPKSRHATHPRKGSSERPSHLLSIVPRIWGTPSLLAAAGVVAVAIGGVFFLSTEFNQLTIFREHTEVHRSFENIMEANGGGIPVYVIAETDGDPLAPEHARELLAFEAELERSPAVAKVVSVYDAYALLHAGLQGIDVATYPSTQKEVAYIEELLAGENDPTAHLVSRKDKATRLIVFPSDLGNQTLGEVERLVASGNSSMSGADLTLTGPQFLMRELNEAMTGNQAKTMVLAFSSILVLLLISFRELKPAALSILPILLTMIIILGFMGIVGISLNLFTATIFSIAMGVGIDYAVHFTSVWMSFRKSGETSQHAAEKTLKYTGRPIVANAVGLAVGLSALLLSPLQIHVYMSLLMWVAMGSGVFLSLSFLPTLLGATARSKLVGAHQNERVVEPNVITQP